MDCYVSRQIANHCNSDVYAPCWCCEKSLTEDDKSVEIKTPFDGLQVVCMPCAKNLNELEDMG